MSSDVRNRPSRDRAATGVTGVGRCFGTFGELLQGTLPDRGRGFMVTLPISRYSTARFTVSPGHGEVRVHPQGKEKSRRLAEGLVRVLAPGHGGSLSIRSELPTGKGCASSSADMVATARAVQSALGATVSNTFLAREMGSIEPSDGVMYPGVVSFYHREGMLRSFLGGPPPLTIVGLDEGGLVDTVEFNERSGASNRARRAEYEGLLTRMERAIVRGDLRTVGEISTRSAILNQELLPKAHLEPLLEVSQRYDALGIVAAHSGTSLGVLLGPARGPGTSSAIAAELSRYGIGVRIHHTPNLGNP